MTRLPPKPAAAVEPAAPATPGQREPAEPANDRVAARGETIAASPGALLRLHACECDPVAKGDRQSLKGCIFDIVAGARLDPLDDGW